jgi:uncharacterized protein
MLRLSVVAAFLLLACGAQAAAPAPAKPQQTAKPAAVEPRDDPAKIAAAKEFIALYHPNMGLANVKKMLDAYIPRMVALQKKRNPSFDARKYEAELRPRVMNGSAAKLELQAKFVSRHFTMAELQGLILFFKAPLGKKLAEETPKIQRDLLMMRRQTGTSLPGSTYRQSDGDDEDEDEDEGKPKSQPRK